MAPPAPSTKVQRIMTQPIVRARARGCGAPPSQPALTPRRSRLPRPQNLIFRFLQSKQRICIWLYENTDLRIEGRIIVRPSALTY